MKKTVSLLLAVLLLALVPMQMNTIAFAADGDTNNISPSAVVLPGVEDGAYSKTHFTMSAKAVYEKLFTSSPKTIKVSNFNSGTTQVCISGRLSHSNTDYTSGYTYYVGFAYYSNSAGGYLPVFCEHYRTAVNVIYQTTSADLFNENITYHGYIRNELDGGYVAGDLTYYSLYT